MSPAGGEKAIHTPASAVALRARTHPCFHAGAGRKHGRIHLPVAPGCNIRCGYCDRSYDCVNESRPGVTSRVVSPEEAVEALDRALLRMPYLSVAGIAGPGDPFRHPGRTLLCLELVRKRHSKLHLCVSTNGLAVGEYVRDLAEIGVGFATVTVNAVDPEVGGRIYLGVTDGGSVHSGVAGAGLLLDRQLGAIAALKAAGLVVKVNTVVVPGVNDHHVFDVARRVAGLGADLMNLIGIIPVPGTAFGGVAPPSAGTLAEIRSEASKFLPQMTHCARCRADAAGLLGDDRFGEVWSPCSEAPRVACAGGAVTEPRSRWVSSSPEVRE